MCSGPAHVESPLFNHAIILGLSFFFDAMDGSAEETSAEVDLHR
jgi:hypothetical protein